MDETSRRAFVLKRGEGAPIWSLGGHFTPKLSGEQVDGAFSMTEALAFRATEPPLHIHTREDEAWYVIDGQMTLYVGNESFVVGSGSFAFAPRGLAHSFTVDIEPTRVLVFATPAGFEHFAMELGTPADSEAPPSDLAVPAPDVLGPVGARYGIQVVGPPIRIARSDARDG
jgi:mannose-6-phosphate isomerase-like protein (cupin superfamily)